MKIESYFSILVCLLISCGTLTGNPEGTGGDDASDESRDSTEVIDSGSNGENTAENESEDKEGNQEGVKPEQDLVVLSKDELLAQQSGDSLIRIFLTDAPVDDFSAIMINLDKIVLIGENGPIEKDIDDLEINLLDLQGGAAALIADFNSAPYGKYTEIRLVLTAEDSSYGVLNTGEQTELTIPSSSSSGIKIKYEMEFKEGESTDIILDYDLRKSVKKRGNSQYFMTPVLRALSLVDTGGIEIIYDSKDGLLCAYSDLSAAQGDTECENAISSANEIDGKYLLSYLPQGTYVAKFIFQDKSIEILDNIIVEAGNITEASFDN